MVTRQIKVGNVKIGGGAPVSIQSMAKTVTSDVRSTVAEIKKLSEAGCEIVRVAVKTKADADAIRNIKRRVDIPLVCDIHFDYTLALESIKNGADKIRLNPGNINKRDEIKQVVRAAKRKGIPIRIGVNSGSLVKGSKNRLSSGLVDSAIGYAKLFEAMDFHDIIISLKASDVRTTVEAYRAIAGMCDYPLHLGVTASGPYDSGIVKSSVGIGTLLLDGIGDTIRVSLTADPVEEVIAAKHILSAVGLRHFGPEIISCPTCGRCQVDLLKIVNDFERMAMNLKKMGGEKMRIAIMGCEVNGPGEAKEADIGLAFGKNSGILFKKGKMIKRISIEGAAKELVKNI